MTPRRFYVQLAGLSVAVALVLAFLLSYPAFQSFQLISWTSWAFFILLTVLLFYIGKKAAVSRDKNAFIQLILIATFLKMVLSILLLVAYDVLQRPESRLFVIPFLIVYLIYTIFETYIMVRLARIGPPSRPKEQKNT